MADTNTIEIFPFEKRYWYPHMKPADVAIWERFIAKYPTAYERCQYDVPCGSAPQFDTVVSPDTRGDNEILYKKKIDVVAFKGEQIDIIELKPRAGAAAVGQIKLYKKLYVNDYNPPETPRCIIVTDEASVDIHNFAKEEGVQIIVV